MNNRFPLLFGIAVVGSEMLLALLMWHSAPPGTRWLGDTMQNSSDAAVYLSYLRQGADGHVLLKNLYAVEPHALRFDAVWSTLGQAARIFPPIVVQEGARAVFTLLLAFAVFFVARSLTESHRDARLATLLAFGGVGAGWLYSIWLGANGLWSPQSYAAPDVVTEFSIAPVLLGGVHMILSLALLVTALRFGWKIGQAKQTKHLRIAASCIAFLFLFHPYFAPLIAIFFCVSLLLNRKRLHLSALQMHAALLAASIVPAAIIYVPLLQDPVFRTHHLETNMLPLAPWPAMLATFLPFIAAFVWRFRRRVRIQENEQWLFAWILAVAVCLLLPFPWKRKLTEGLGVALVLLTLPAWFAIRGWIQKGRVRIVSLLTGGALLLAACFTPLHLFVSHLRWIERSSEQHWFYQPNDVFSAWSFLHAHTPPTSVVTSDDAWVNLWIPSYAGRTTWVAHDHETPDYAKKLSDWKRLMTTDDPIEARGILATNNITHLLLTTPLSLERFKRLLGDTWTTAFHEGDAAILEQQGGFPNVAMRVSSHP